MIKGLAGPLLEKLGGSCPRAREGSHPACGRDGAPCALPAWGWIWQGWITEALGAVCHRAGAGRYLGQRPNS